MPEFYIIYARKKLTKCSEKYFPDCFFFLGGGKCLSALPVSYAYEYFTLKYLKKIHGNFEIFQDPFFEIFHEVFNFHYEGT